MAVNQHFDALALPPNTPALDNGAFFSFSVQADYSLSCRDPNHFNYSDWLWIYRTVQAFGLTSRDLDSRSNLADFFHSTHTASLVARAHGVTLLEWAASKVQQHWTASTDIQETSDQLSQLFLQRLQLGTRGSWAVLYNLTLINSDAASATLMQIPAQRMDAAHIVMMVARRIDQQERQNGSNGSFLFDTTFVPPIENEKNVATDESQLSYYEDIEYDGAALPIEQGKRKRTSQTSESGRDTKKPRPNPAPETPDPIKGYRYQCEACGRSFERPRDFESHQRWGLKRKFGFRIVSHALEPGALEGLWKAENIQTGLKYQGKLVRGKSAAAPAGAVATVCKTSIKNKTNTSLSKEDKKMKNLHAKGEGPFKNRRDELILMKFDPQTQTDVPVAMDKTVADDQEGIGAEDDMEEAEAGNTETEASNTPDLDDGDNDDEKIDGENSENDQNYQDEWFDDSSWMDM